MRTQRKWAYHELTVSYLKKRGVVSASHLIHSQYAPQHTPYELIPPRYPTEAHAPPQHSFQKTPPSKRPNRKPVSHFLSSKYQSNFKAFNDSDASNISANIYISTSRNLESPLLTKNKPVFLQPYVSHNLFVKGYHFR